MRRTLSVLPILCAAAGCHGPAPQRPAATPAPPRIVEGGWRSIATSADRARLRGWRDTMIAALARAKASGAGAKIAAEGVLLEPDRGLPGPVPPMGAYRCRILKIGAQGRGLPEYTAYPAFRCRIDAARAGALSFVKLDGSQRPIGTLYPQDGERMIFLGTMVLGDERRALDYGRDPERDMAGAVERIGARRWRLLLPAPRWESLFDVMELVPA